MSSSTRSADALISYALDAKPGQSGERYVMASGVGGLLVSVAKQQMRDVRKKWGKDKRGAYVQAYHVIESFGRDELDPASPDAWMTAQKLGRALAEDRFPGRQALVVTQRDGKTGCLHNHIVVNALETRTGRSLDSSIVMHARLVEAHERVLEEQGFEQRADLKQAFSDAVERRERGEPSRLHRAHSREQRELREFQRYILWETDSEIADEFGLPRTKEPFSETALKARIENALSDPTTVDWDSFVAAGSAHGVRVEQRGGRGRGISYGMLREMPDGTRAEPSASDKRRCTSLGPAFQMDAVEAAIAQHRAISAHGVAPQPNDDVKPQRIKSAASHMAVALAEAEKAAEAASKKLLEQFYAARSARPSIASPAPQAAELPPATPPAPRTQDAADEDVSADASTGQGDDELTPDTRPEPATVTPPRAKATNAPARTQAAGQRERRQPEADVTPRTKPVAPTRHRRVPFEFFEETDRGDDQLEL